MKLSKIGLGTAQLGMNYGINNISGKPNIAESKKIVELATKNNINVFDTAPEYGDSEKILGQCLAETDKKNIIIISKIPPTDWNKNSKYIITSLRKKIKETLKNLNIKQIPIYLFHRFEDIEKNNSLILNELKKMKKQTKIKKIGVSTYTPEEAEKALSIDGIEVIQVPFNLIDKRLLENGFLKRVKKKNITIIARSIYLQGLFFKENIPEKLKDFEQYKDKLLEISKEENISLAELALRYVLSINEIDTVLIGLEKEQQLKQNLKIIKKGKLSKRTIKNINSIRSAPEKIIDPRQW